MSISEALRCCHQVFLYFSCSNGAQIALKITKAQVREIAEGSRLDKVFTHINDEDAHEPTARWQLSDNGQHLHLFFLT